MKRWIIRSFFTGLLLLFLGGWAVSYHYAWNVGYIGGNLWQVDCYWGKFHLNWLQDMVPGGKGWTVSASPVKPSDDLEWIAMFRSHYYLGFGIINVNTWSGGLISIAVPYYFPTSLFAALLLLVWRWTRPKVKGRAFPVELEQGKEKP